MQKHHKTRALPNSAHALPEPARFKPASWLAAAVGLLLANAPALAQTPLPADVKPSCVVPAKEFNAWFAGGAPTLNGLVKPADSLHFTPQNHCDFYKWSAQMLLWLTSPSAAAAGKDHGIVMDTPLFYDVGNIDSQGQRSLKKISADSLRRFGPTITQFGPEGKPVIMDDKGVLRTLILLEANPAGKPLIRDKAGVKTEIAGLEIAKDGKPAFLNAAKQKINAQTDAGGLPQLFDKAGNAVTLAKNSITIKGKPVLLDKNGNVVQTETGQADGSVLISQSGKIVYYALTVNDVYAYFMTGAKNLAFTPAPTQFPTSGAALAQIIDYGKQHAGGTFPDANALTMELKTSWVEVEGLPDPNQYITITAQIPTYDASSPTKWTPTGDKTAKLALVGVHVVGSAAGHPEMLWSSFEHVHNSPNAGYAYLNTKDAKVNVAQNTRGKWLFSASDAQSGFNINTARIDQDHVTILQDNNLPIGPYNVLREFAWGTNSASAAALSDNTDVISVNSSVLSQLAAGDIRKNYLQIGNIWTNNGVPPKQSGDFKGSVLLANSTMETTFQKQPNSCFTCHTGKDMLGTPTGGGLSHIWGTLLPLNK